MCKIRVAFLGDAGTSRHAAAVLSLVASEKVHLVVHQGDMGYGEAERWIRMVKSTVGEQVPYIYSMGNHDQDAWPHYAEYLKQTIDGSKELRCEALDNAASEGTADTLACHFRGLFIVLMNLASHDTSDLTRQRVQSLAMAGQVLEKNSSKFQICSWHRADASVSLGELDLHEGGLEPYEVCRASGAIIATAHSHNYARTKTLASFDPMTVDMRAPDPRSLLVRPGSTFAFVSGLGGEGMDEVACRPPRETCPAWASANDSEYGALFLDFGCEPLSNRATGYFKTVTGTVTDTFSLTSLR